MKKIISLCVVVVLCLLCACNTRNNIRDQASSAPYLDLTNFFVMQQENQAKAASEFDGNVYRYTGTVVYIGHNYCTLGIYSSGDWLYQMDVYLAEEDLVQLINYETYTFVGEFNSSVIRPALKKAILVD